jgi:hypothetical protein
MSAAPPKAYSGTGVKSFYGLHFKGGPVKNLHTKPERMSVAEWAGFGL